MTVETTVLQPVQFTVPLLNPSPQGLYASTVWDDSMDPPRFMAGVEFWPYNYGGDLASGVWDVAWCEDPGENLKTGVRPDFLDPFEPIVAWAYDECDMTAYSRALIEERAAQTLRLQEQVSVEHEFAIRMLADAGTPAAAADIVAGVGALEALLAETNTVGMIHASAGLAAKAAAAFLIVRSGTGLKTPLGHTWVFGGGYVAGLGDKLVATSQTFGWRNPAEVRTAIKPQQNVYAAVAERAVVVGYEAAVGAVDLA